MAATSISASLPSNHPILDKTKTMIHPTFRTYRRRAAALLACAIAVSISIHASPSALQTLHGHVPAAATKAKPVSKLDETTHLSLAIGLPARNQADLTALVHDLYDPASPQFHKYLKPAEFAARFGPTEEDYAAVKAYMESNGLRVTQTHSNRLLVDVDGPVASIQKAFHVNMNVFQHPKENRTYYAPDKEPSLDANLRVQHIAGLNSYQLPKPLVVKSSNSNHTETLSGTAPGGNFMGRDFRNAYAPGVTLSGAGQSVALVEFDTYYAKDITTYETTANLPAVKLVNVPIDGFSSAPGGGAIEVSLDIEMAIAMAPGLSQVLVYEEDYGAANGGDDMLNQMAVDDAANQISCSWIFEIDATTDTIFQQMAAQGQSFFTACGDSGAYNYNPLPLDSDANIMVVGGTTLTTTGGGAAYVSETVWQGATNSNYGPGVAGSGGISSVYPIPYWQQPVNMSSNLGSTVWRNVPDISMTADQVYVTYDNGATTSVGGTSCAAPLWAGYTALINQQAALYGRPPAGFLNPALYNLAHTSLYTNYFHDTVTGNNTNLSGTNRFYAMPGYDLCTGWGTPVGQALINALSPPDSLFFEPSAGISFSIFGKGSVAGQTRAVIFTNTELTTVEWSAGPRPSWLTMPVVKAALTNFGSSAVTFTVATAASSLPAGTYMTNLVITNLDSGVLHIFPVTLVVKDPLSVSLTNNFLVTGPSGGPFTPAAPTVLLSNASPITINWTAQTASPYFTMSPSNGTFTPGMTTNVFVTPTAAASNLLITVQTGSLGFTDTTTGATISQPFTIDVGNGDFETGDFSYWNFNAQDFPANFVGAVTNGWNDFDGYDYILSGEFSAVLGQTNELGSITQTLVTTPGQAYVISLFIDNPVGGATNQFVVKWNGYTLYSKLEVPVIHWTNMLLLASSATTNSTLEIDFRNDPDYFGLDNITVTPISQPQFSSFSVGASTIQFQWPAITGYLYRLQYTTNLAGPWTYFGNNIKATNSIMTLTEPLPVDLVRYYRLVLSGL